MIRKHSLDTAQHGHRHSRPGDAWVHVEDAARSDYHFLVFSSGGSHDVVLNGSGVTSLHDAPGAASALDRLCAPEQHRARSAIEHAKGNTAEDRLTIDGVPACAEHDQIAPLLVCKLQNGLGLIP